MVFGILIIILLLLIAFFHYLQGFFSATLSAIFSVLAAACAVSYAEPLVALLKPTKFADSATGAFMICIFVVVYLLLRVLFDKLVPGNLRVQSTVDKVGGAVMGLVAGVFATGVVAIAAQSMPVHPSDPYERYPLGQNDSVRVKSGTDNFGSALMDRQMKEFLKTDGRTYPEQASGMIVPVDDIVLSVVGHISDGGSLAGDRPLASIHPDWLQELFGQRLYPESGAKHTAYNYSTTPQVQVKMAYTIPPAQFEIKDAEVEGVRKGEAAKSVPYTLEPGKVPVIVRAVFAMDAGDEDHIVRMTAAAVRLLVPTDAGDGKVTYANHYPVGTVEEGHILYATRVDDLVLLDVKEKSAAADFLFLLDPAEVDKPGSVPVEGKPAVPARGGLPARFKPGSFFEAKRWGRVALEGDTADIQVNPPEAVTGVNANSGYAMAVMRKKEIANPAPPTLTTPPVVRAPAPPVPPPTQNPAAAPVAPVAPPVPAADSGPLALGSPSWNSRLPTKVGGGNGADGPVLTSDVTGEIKGGKWVSLLLGTPQAMRKLALGGAASELIEPPAGKVALQITAKPVGGPWDWAAHVNEYEAVDDKGQAVKPQGVWASVKMGASPEPYLVAAVDPDKPVSMEKTDGTPTDVTLLYFFPAGTGLKEIHFKGKTAAVMSLPPAR